MLPVKTFIVIGLIALGGLLGCNKPHDCRDHAQPYAVDVFVGQSVPVPAFESTANHSRETLANLHETKGGGYCPTCPNARPAPAYRPPAAQPTYRPPSGQTAHRRPATATVNPHPYGIVLNPGEVLLSVGPVRNVPQSQPLPAARPDVMPSEHPNHTTGTAEPKEGVFRCTRCRRATVGRDWHELWSDDGTPLTYLCESCWRSTSDAERNAYFAQYARSAGLTPQQIQTARNALRDEYNGGLRDK